ncbi:MAG: U32 family peptidase [Elusimicrobiota bacterium]|nr:U32 family peptidase [Elusimicrobiota bacterium]
MKIVSCFSDLRELEPLAKAGADEFYTAIGSLPAFSIGVLPGPDLAPAIKKAHALGKRIALAVNAIHAPATDKRLAAIERRIRGLDALGIDAFIFSNPYLLGLFSGRGRRLRAELHLSSVQPVFNSLSAAFFSRFGLSRLILPNQLSPHEARKILVFCRARGLETEIFDYRFFGCAYVNGRCHLHRPDHYTLKSAILEGDLCRINAAPGGLVKPRTLDLPGRAGELPGLIKRLEDRFTCGGSPRLSNAAAFFDFFASGVQYLKYGTRHDSPDVKVKKVGELRAMLNLAEKLSSAGPKAEARRAFVVELSRWNGGGF